MGQNIRMGLPQGQLSFLSGSDTLPTAMNLRRICDSRCQPCPRPTTAQIHVRVLSSCTKTLNQGRYTWRHDSVKELV